VTTEEIVDLVLQQIGAFTVGWVLGKLGLRLIRRYRRKPSLRRTP